jgi:hypothetical protein
MPGATPIYGFPYPDPSDLVANYPALGQDLAEDVETVIAALGSGLNLITATTFSAQSSVSFNNVFTATYQNYLLSVTVENTLSTTNYMRLRVAGSDSSANYSMRSAYFESVYTATTETGSVRFGSNGTEKVHVNVNLSDVALAAPTSIYASGNDAAPTTIFATGGVHTLSTAYDGFTVICNTGTFTGTIRVYGYENS